MPHLNPEDIRLASEKLDAILKTAQETVKAGNGIVTLLERPGATFGPGIQVYAELLRSNEVATFQELDQLIQEAGSCNAGLEDTIDDFWNAEDQWDAFLNMLDQKTAFPASLQVIKSIGEVAPIEAVLVNALKTSNGKEETLGSILTNCVGKHAHLVLLRHLS
jgi:hypothetical protein